MVFSFLLEEEKKSAEIFLPQSSQSYCNYVSLVFSTSARRQTLVQMPTIYYIHYKIH